MIKMGDYERGLIRCHPKCMTSAGRDARMQILCLFVCLWCCDVMECECECLFDKWCVCHVVVLQEGSGAHDT